MPLCVSPIAPVDHDGMPLPCADLLVWCAALGSSWRPSWAAGMLLVARSGRSRANLAIASWAMLPGAMQHKRWTISATSSGCASTRLALTSVLKPERVRGRGLSAGRGGHGGPHARLHPWGQQPGACGENSGQLPCTRCGAHLVAQCLCGLDLLQYLLACGVGRSSDVNIRRNRVQSPALTDLPGGCCFATWLWGNREL
jgi:hypothetical protein